MKISPGVKNDLKRFLVRTLRERDEEVTVLSACKLDKTDMDMVFKMLKGVDKDAVHVEVDPTLMAGIVIKKGSKVLDLSLKAQLEQLQR